MSLPCLDTFSCCGVNPFSVIVKFPKTLNEQVVRRVKEQVDIVSERQRDLRIRKTELHLDELEETYKCCVCLKAGEYRDAEREEVAVLQKEEEERLKRTLQYRTINLSNQVIQGTTNVATKSTNLVLGGVTESAKFLGNTTVAVARKTKDGVAGGLSTLAHLARTGDGGDGDLEMTQRSAADVEEGSDGSNLSRVDSMNDMRKPGRFGLVGALGGGVHKRVKWLTGLVVKNKTAEEGAAAAAAPVPAGGIGRRKVNLTGKAGDTDSTFKLNLGAAAPGSPAPKQPFDLPKHVSIHDEDSQSPLGRESSTLFVTSELEPQGLNAVAQAALDAQDSDGRPLWDTEAVLRQLPRYYFTNDDKELEAAWKRKKALSTYHKDKGLVRIHDTDHLMLSSFYNKPVRGFLCVECYSAARHRLDHLHRHIELIVLRGSRPFLSPAVMAALERSGDFRESTRAANALERRLRRELRVERMAVIPNEGVGPRVKRGADNAKSDGRYASKDSRIEAFRRGLHKLEMVDGVVISDMDRRMLEILTRTPAYIRSLGMGVLPEVVILNLRTHVQCSICRWRTSTYFQPKAFAFLCHFCCARDKILRNNCICINNEPMASKLVYVLSRLSTTISERGLVPSAKDGAVQLRRLATKTKNEAKAQRRKPKVVVEVSTAASTNLFDNAEGTPTVSVSVSNPSQLESGANPTFELADPQHNQDVEAEVYAEMLRQSTFMTEYGLTPIRAVSLNASRQRALTSLFTDPAPPPAAMTSTMQAPTSMIVHAPHTGSHPSLPPALDIHTTQIPVDTSIEEPVEPATAQPDEEEEPTAETTAEVEEPTTEVEEPTAEVEEPIAELEEPTTEVEEPIVELEEPTTEVEEPIVELEEPTTEVEEPTAEVEEPTAEVEEPTAEVEEPTAEIDEPITEEAIAAEVKKPNSKEATAGGNPFEDDSFFFASPAPTSQPALPAASRDTRDELGDIFSSNTPDTQPSPSRPVEKRSNPFEASNLFDDDESLM